MVVRAGRSAVDFHVLLPEDAEPTSVMVDGRFVMRDHRVLTVDEAALMEEAYRIGERVWGRILRDGPLPIPTL